MARRSLKDLKKQLKEQENSKSNNTGGFFYPFWRLPFDCSTRFRVLEDPDQDNPMIVYREWLEHKLDIGDEKVTIPCPKNNGKTVPCPICELSAKLYSADNKVRGKYYYRDGFLILRGLIIKDGLEYDDDEDNSEGQVKVFKMTYQLANKFKAEMGKLDDDEDFWDLDNGLDFEIIKSKQPGDDQDWGKYDLASGFVRKNTSVPEEMRDEIPEDTLLSILHEIPSYDEVHEVLQKHLRDVSGHGDSDADDDDNTESEDDLMEKLNRNKADKKKKKEKKEEKKAKKQEADDDLDEDVTIFDNDDDDDDDVDDLLSILDDDDDD